MKRRCIPLNKFIFRRKPSEKKEQSLLRLLLPSVLGFALCFVCLAATTWAWFTVSVTSEANTIQTASFGVEVYLDGSATPATVDANGNYALATGKYIVKMSKTGDATGYFDFKVNGTQYRTTAFTAASPITIKIENNGPDPITCSFTSSWGTPDGTTVGNNQAVTFNAVLPPEIISITDGETIIVGEPSEEPTDESEQENQQQEEENPSDENNPADDSENNGEGESKPETPAEGEGGQQGGEQQGDEPSETPDDEGEQQGDETSETPDVSGETTGGDIGDDTSTDTTTTTGGETPTDTTTAGGDVPTEPVATTDPAPIE